MRLLTLGIVTLVLGFKVVVKAIVVGSTVMESMVSVAVGVVSVVVGYVVVLEEVVETDVFNVVRLSVVTVLIIGVARVVIDVVVALVSVSFGGGYTLKVSVDTLGVLLVSVMVDWVPGLTCPSVVDGGSRVVSRVVSVVVIEGKCPGSIIGFGVVVRWVDS